MYMLLYSISTNIIAWLFWTNRFFKYLPNNMFTVKYTHLFTFVNRKIYKININIAIHLYYFQFFSCSSTTVVLVFQTIFLLSAIVLSINSTYLTTYFHNLRLCGAIVYGQTLGPLIALIGSFFS